MTKYETMLVTSTKLDEEATAALVDKFKTLIEANGTLDGVDEWGKRKLAYPINKEEDGLYTLIHFTSGIEFPAELNRNYKITDGVLRTLIVVKPEVEEVVEKKKEEAKAAELATETPKAEEVIVEEIVEEVEVEQEASE